MKEWEKIRAYRDYIRELLCQVHVQEATQDTVHCLKCGAFNVRESISEDTLILGSCG